MAVEKHVLTMTFRAGEDLSGATNLYKFVKLESDGDIILCTDPTDIPIGVLQNLPASGNAAAVCMLGISKIQADEDLAIGDLIGPSADGQADIKLAGTDTSEYIAGRCLENTSAAGQYTTCSLNCMAPVRGT